MGIDLRFDFEYVFLFLYVNDKYFLFLIKFWLKNCILYRRFYFSFVLLIGCGVVCYCFIGGVRGLYLGCRSLGVRIDWSLYFRIREGCRGG